MQKELDNYLSQALKRLEKAHTEILKTQTYNKDVQKIQLLKELVKEQIKNENPSSSTR